jgi:hypothetical protein
MRTNGKTVLMDFPVPITLPARPPLYKNGLAPLVCFELLGTKITNNGGRYARNKHARTHFDDERPTQGAWSTHDGGRSSAQCRLLSAGSCSEGSFVARASSPCNSRARFANFSALTTAPEARRRRSAKDACSAIASRSSYGAARVHFLRFFGSGPFTSGCLRVLVAPYERDAADEPAGSPFEQLGEFRRNRSAPVSVADRLNGYFLFGCARAAREFCLRAAQVYGSVERVADCLLSIVHGGIKRHV